MSNVMILHHGRLIVVILVCSIKMHIQNLIKCVIHTDSNSSSPTAVTSVTPSASVFESSTAAASVLDIKGKQHMYRRHTTTKEDMVFVNATTFFIFFISIFSPHVHKILDYLL